MSEFFTREVKPLMELAIDWAPSVQVPTQSSQDRPFVSRFEEKTLYVNISRLFLCNKRLLEFNHHLQIKKCYNVYW